MSMTINLIPDLETQVRQGAKREGLAPETYLNKLLSRYLRQEAVTVPGDEANLLQQISAGPSEKVWQRCEYLRGKLQSDDLTEEEQQELIEIADLIEEANVHRVEALIQLAKLRNTSVEQLMSELGIRPPTYV